MTDNHRPAIDLNRRPSRLLAAYTKAMERAKQEALVPPHVDAPPPRPSKPAAAPRPQVIADRPAARLSVQKPVALRVQRAPARRSTITPQRVIVACACLILIGVGPATILRDTRIVDTVESDSIALPPIAARTLPPSSIVVPTPVNATSVRPPKEVSRQPATELASAVVSRPTDRARPRSTPPSSPDSITTTAPGDQWLSPRLVKLGIRASWRGSAVGVGDPVLTGELQQALAQLSIGRMIPNRDVIFLGATAAEDVRQLDAARSALKSGGVLWVVLPRNPDAGAAVEEHLRSAEFAARRRVDLSGAQQAIAFVARSDRANVEQRTQP
jgi:hypothetical protein